MPLAIVRTVADRQVIAALSPEAAGFGIRPGMTLTQAKALCAHVQHAEYEPQRDRRALEALARWLMRFSPVVAIAQDDVAWAARPCLSSKQKTMGGPPMPPGIFLDLTGCDRLFGGIKNLVRQIREAFLHLHITARLAVAPTPGAAWALAEAARFAGSAPRTDLRAREITVRGADPTHSDRAVESGASLSLVPGVNQCNREFVGSALRTDSRAREITVRSADPTQIAYAHSDGIIVSLEDLPAALAPLPPAALRISDDLIAALHHLGLETIGQVSNLPRDVLPARFGKELLLRLDQALGHIPEPLVPLEHHAPVEAKMEFEFSISSLETIWIASKHLLQQIIDQLTHRGCGARRLDLELSRAHAPAVKKSITLSHPSRNAKSLFSLVQCALEENQLPRRAGIARREAPFSGQCPPDDRRVRLGGRVQDAHVARNASAKADPTNFSPSHRPTLSPSLSPSIHADGYTALHFRVPLLQRVTDEQIFLLEQAHHAGQLEVDRLIDRLRLRLGEEAVAQVELVESHLPEKAWRVGGWRVGSEEWGVRSREKERAHIDVSYSPLHTPHSPLFQFPPTPHSQLPTLFRPLHLFPTPIEVRVMVTPSHAAEGRPAAFVHAHRVHQVTNWSGPQRIAGCWWDGHNKTRDYFEVEDPAGRRFWIFRVSETGKWYLHGSYE